MKTEPLPLSVAQAIRESFARQSMMASLGAELALVEHGRIEITAPVRPEFCQQQGFGHAAVAFAIGDTAAGYAALSVLPPGGEVMTAEMKINLLAPSSGRLRAEGRVIRAGRRLVIVTADVWGDGEGDGARRHVAVMQGTMIPVPA